MDGWVTVSKYAELAGVSKDTAWHRVYRGTVPRIKLKGTEDLVLFKQKPVPDIPDGYVLKQDYCKAHGIRINSFNTHMARNKLREDGTCIIVGGNGIKKKTYVRSDYEYTVVPKNMHRKAKHHASCPDGYLTIGEWADAHNMKKVTAKAYALNGKIPSIKNGYYRYIPIDAEYKTR